MMGLGCVETFLIAQLFGWVGVGCKGRVLLPCRAVHVSALEQETPAGGLRRPPSVGSAVLWSHGAILFMG